jgi:NAD(P)-dependent dehydrogenase (short-subunit alcohol dehydrogenase family)
VRAFAGAVRAVDVLVNCAAITRRGEEMAPDFFSHVLDVNLTGPSAAPRRCMPR